MPDADVTRPVVLPADVVLARASALPASLRRALDAREGDWALAHPRARARAKLVDRDAAALLKAFREPALIAQAVLDFAERRGLAPDDVLSDAYPLLRACLDERLLVPADSPDARPVTASLRRGARIAGGTVRRCLQVLPDGEIYLLERGAGRAALKIARRADDGRTVRTLAHEARVLAWLAGRVGPTLLARGAHEGRPWLLLSWQPGRPLDAAAGKPGPANRARLHRLAVALVDVYRRLHEAGVVHGDVHPRNALVDKHGVVGLVDFGLACITSGARGSAPFRGAVPQFFAPEQAAALIAGRGVAAPTPRAEQHAVAALVYQLATGAHYIDFSPREETLLRQVVRDAPIPFARRAIAPWPDLERALGRALAKRPGRRFPTMAAFVAAVRAAAPPSAFRGPAFDPVRVLLSETGLDGALLARGLPSPRASLHYGAAGLAWALHRVACVQGDARLAARADVWLTRAEQDVAARLPGLGCAALGVSSRQARGAGLHHGSTGVQLARALMAAAQHDIGGQAAAVSALAEATPAGDPELGMGAAGLLLAMALAQEALLPGVSGTGLAVAAGRAMRRLRAGRPRPGLGIAHGAAGALYATLRWCRASAAPLPAFVEPELDSLAARGELLGRGMRWPWVAGRHAEHASPGRRWPTMPGWCNGSGGFVHLWLAAHQVLGGRRYLDLAERSGCATWEDRGPAWDLCCGTAGGAYALLALYRTTGRRTWLDRARRLAHAAAEGCRAGGSRRPWSLYRGLPGVAVLLAELEQPDLAAMPLFA